MDESAHQAHDESYDRIGNGTGHTAITCCRHIPRPHEILSESSMSDRAEGTVADTGEAIQRHINRADEAADQLTQFIRERPITAVLMAMGVGYLLAKIL